MDLRDSRQEYSDYVLEPIIRLFEENNNRSEFKDYCEYTTELIIFEKYPVVF